LADFFVHFAEQCFVILAQNQNPYLVLS